jgi:hypothetical protein
MIPELIPWAENLGLRVVFFPLVFAGLFTLFVMLAQSLARLFDDRKS